MAVIWYGVQVSLKLHHFLFGMIIEADIPRHILEVSLSEKENFNHADER
jgi:hypothetical protein